jgi:hypothetical protein
MTDHQLRGHIGGNMAGTEIYDVCIVFSVYADNDDEALHKVTRDLEYGKEDVEWAWIYTKHINKGEASE